MGHTRGASAKREEGLKKKARELATLCDVDVCLVGVAPDGSFFCWPDDIAEVRRIAHRYLETVGDASTAGAAKRKRAAAVGENAFGEPPVKRSKGENGAGDAHEEQQGQGEANLEASPDVYISNLASSTSAAGWLTHLEASPNLYIPSLASSTSAAGWLPPLAPSYKDTPILRERERGDFLSLADSTDGAWTWDPVEEDGSKKENVFEQRGKIEEEDSFFGWPNDISEFDQIAQQYLQDVEENGKDGDALSVSPAERSKGL